ncbi:MAG TPA: PDZ domain-containing protein, partial [Kofleriaceae bacterium]
RGIVIGADHKPAADSWVTARMERDKPKGLPEGMEDRLDWFTATEPVLTNAEGRFTIDKLKKGKYALVADGPRGSSRGEKKGVMTGDSATIQLASLGTLTVTVTQADKPVTKYDVSCDGPAGDVDRHVEAATGEYQLEHLAPGDYKCTVRADAGTSEGKVTVPTGEAKLALKIATWGSLSGVVVSVLTGKPVPGLSVVATGIGDQRGMLEAIAGHAPKTDPTGRFVVERVAAGKGTVMFMPKDGGFTNMESHPYEAKEGQRVDLGTIKIVPPRSGDAGTFGLSTEPDGDSLKVTAVKEGGPAALAGVVVGDKITAVAQQSVKTLTPPLAQKLIASGAIGVGETVSLALERGQTVTLTSIKW